MQKQQEQLSALFDNELTHDQQHTLLEAVLAKPELQQQLTQFQLIRDVLQASYAEANSSLVESC